MPSVFTIYHYMNNNSTILLVEVVVKCLPLQSISFQLFSNDIGVHCWPILVIELYIVKCMHIT